MTTSDKTLLGICVLSLSIGFLQHGCSKRKTAELSQNTESARNTTPSNTPDTSSAGTTLEWSGGDLTPYVEFTHVVNNEPLLDTSKSKNKQRLAAIREKNKTLESEQPVQFPKDFDPFPAREGMKKTLFSNSFNGGSNTLSEAEKWALIDSGNLPW